LRILRFSSQLQLFNIILILFLVAHWIACGWLVVRGFDANLDLKNNYVNALYWSVTTVTTVGYGDVTPVNMIEKIYSMVTMLVGLGIFGFFIGSISSILSKKDPAREHYYDNLEELSQIVRYRSLSPSLQKRIHDYYTYKWQKRLGFDEEHFLQGLPSGLKMQVALYLKKDVIESIPLFKDAPQSFIESISLHLQPMVCTPGDYVFKAGDDAEEMYFIIQGNVSVLSPSKKEIAALSDGDFFGEISLFKERTRTASIQAKGYCDLYRLSKRSYKRVISRYPGIAKQIEKEAELREERNRFE
jgi:voltage-gated potassium channel